MNEFIKKLRSVLPEINEEFTMHYNTDNTRKRIEERFRTLFKSGSLMSARCTTDLNPAEIIMENKCVVMLTYLNHRGVEVFCMATLYQQPMIEYEDEEGWYIKMILKV